MFAGLVCEKFITSLQGHFHVFVYVDDVYVSFLVVFTCLGANSFSVQPV